MLPSHEYGLKNESDIINYLNGKKFCDLNDKWKKHIQKMFSFVTGADKILCSHYEDQSGKPDIVITVRHTNIYVSIKSGRNSSMHQEPFETFKMFLEKKGVTKRTLRILELFQYGKTDKCGPFTPKELEERFKSYFKEANKELNDRSLIDAVVFRCILKGCVLKRYKVNFLYYGNLDHGYILSEEDIYSLVHLYRNQDKTPIHFGGLNFQPASRNKKRLSYLNCRIKWPILALLYYRTDEEINDIVSGKIRV